MANVDPRLMANAIRFLSMDAIERADEGHPGTPLGGADIATALFTRHLKYNPKAPEWPDRDRFVQSNGHGSMLIYSLLYLTGYEKITIEEIKRFRELGSECPGHPEYNPAAGIETTTGPLGQGIANAVGMAVTEAALNQRFGSDIVDHYTYALVGDGCLMEGIAQEVISLAGHLRLGKLIVLWDDNRITDDGVTMQALSDDVRGRFQISGWQVIDVDGHDPEALEATIRLAKTDPRPSMIACRTTIGAGVARIAGKREAHGSRIFKEDTAAARELLAWPHAPFDIPADILGAWREAGRRGETDYRAWQARFAALDPKEQAEFDRMMAGKLPDGWVDTLAAFKRRMEEERPEQATVRSSGMIVELLAEAIPELMGGAPDLEAATKHKNHMIPFTADNRAGRYIHYGVREHAMGSMMNGMVAHRGLKPYGITFLVFSDYERPALRMAAMMGLSTLFLFSHDSIGIGKNGPTHQPIEMLASLRAIPNMYVFRPADAVETAECWEMALMRKDGPSSLIFSRQAVPAVRLAESEENRSARGAYVLTEAEAGPRRVTLFATGSEVGLAVKARRLLETDGVGTAVVSMPCWEVFEEQDEDYRNAVLGKGTVCVAVEAAARIGWDRYIGPDGAFVGMSTFGASGPLEEVFIHFGITAEHVVQEARRRL
ncbi:Transketolase [uncultured Pleomorphomonas sp.]|uniref:Transketolase n=1 Tax=uncultured Pleomorphomonas sp. TaxID=442121 RepID=A0A212LGN5_9HYPH|nr:transketolase [uncultured Pleomorphomonas sp.]SCM76549.1 Transketolase [uncultured Pleomorphomonas sp.]